MRTTARWTGYTLIENPNRKWYQIWKPRMVWVLKEVKEKLSK